MKKYLIIIAFLLGTTYGFEQTDAIKHDGYKWTIGTILINEQNCFFDKKFKPNVFTGILFKRHLDSFSTRLGIEYVKLIDKIDEPECCDQLNSEGYTNEGMIRFGVEKGFTFKEQYKLYFALDLTGIKSYSDKIITGGIAGINQRVTINTVGYGLIPTIGLEYNIIKNLSVGLETRLQLINTKNTHQTENPINSTNTYEEQYMELKKTLNRIGALTLNFYY